MKRFLKAITKMTQMVLFNCSSSLVNKLILLFTAIILLIVVSFTFISYKMLERESSKNIIDSNSNTLKLVNQNMEDYFGEMDKLTLPNIRYDEVIDALKNEPDDYLAKIFLEHYLRELFYSGKAIESVELYLIQSQKIYYISRSDIFGGVKTTYDEKIPSYEWYKQTIGNARNRYIQSLLFTKETENLMNARCFMAYHRAIINITNRQSMAVLSIYYNPLNRDQILKGVPINKGEHLVFLDSHNIPLYVDDPQYIHLLGNQRFLKQFKTINRSDLFYWRINRRKYLIVYNISTGDNWKLIKFIPDNLIYQAARTNRNLSFVIGGIFLMVAIILVTVTSQAITLRLKKLATKMERFSEGYFNVEAKIKGIDEIAQLAKQFNLMVKKINDLINEEYKMKLTEKNAILKALEAEINPHFLYNALQAISTQALKSNATDVCMMVDALASTFRYCINGGDIVELAEEIKYVKNYIVLQKARFGQRLTVVFDVNDAALQIEIPKLALQTLVENSIKHALEKVASAVTIIIKVDVGSQRAVISVRDNGPGIAPDQLVQIRESLNQDWQENGNPCIGLKNLNTRLKLMFGEEFHLDIRTDKTGTKVSFEVQKGGLCQNVSSSDC